MDTKKYVIETLKYLLRSYPFIRPYIKEIDNLYELDEVSLHKRNEERFLKIFRAAYEKSKFYNKLYSDYGINKDDIKSLEDIKKLPIITKEMVKEHADEMLTVPRWQVIAAHTSGTTGTPLKVYESWPSIWLSRAYTYCTRKRDGFTYGEKLVSLRGNLAGKQTSLFIHASNTLFLSSYNINRNTIRLYYDLIMKHKPRAIEGYPSSLYALAMCMKDANLKLSIPVAFTSSETLFDYQRLLIECQLGTKIFDRYSMVEQTIYLVESYNHFGYYEAPGFSINEYVNDGEICTSLINESFPLIRYKSDDIVEKEIIANDKKQEIIKSIKNGKKTIRHITKGEIVKKIIGRSDDYLICKDGTHVTRVDFIEKGRHIKACQWIQDKPGHLLINIVPDSGFTELDRIFVYNETEKKVGKGNMDIDTKCVTMDQLIYSRRGKFKLIVRLKNE